MANEVPYLEGISHRSRWSGPGNLEEIARSIDADGAWEAVSEWRISTETTYRIEPEWAEGEGWFKVSAKCDFEMACHTPTLERAIEMLSVFDRLIMDLFWTIGWASWAGKGRLEPEPGEILPRPPSTE